MFLMYKNKQKGIILKNQINRQISKYYLFLFNPGDVFFPGMCFICFW